MAKLPDGIITIFKPYKTEIRMVHQELIMCKNCKFFKPLIGEEREFYFKEFLEEIGEEPICHYWEQPTPKGGYCFMAEEKEGD